MFPISNLNRSASPTPYQATASTSSGITLSRQYVTKPQTLDDLVNNRKRLKTSDNEAARILGAALEKVSRQLANMEIDEEQHKEACTDIREAADMFNGLLDVEKEVLAKFGLQGKDNLTLASDEHLAINEDLLCQVDKEILLLRQHAEAARNATERDWANFQRIVSPSEGAQERQPVVQNIRESGVSQDLIALMDQRFPILRDMEFSRHQIDRSFINSGLSQDQIAIMTSHRGGERAIEAVFYQLHSLTEPWFSLDPIAGMANNRREAQALEGEQHLPRFTARWHPLETVLRRLYSFIGWIFQRIENNARRAQAHQAVIRRLSRDRGVSQDQIRLMTRHFPSLIDRGFSPDQIVNMASHPEWLERFKAVLEHFDSLTDMRFSLDQIALMVDEWAIRMVVQHFDSLTDMGFSLDQITHMASNPEGDMAIEAVVEHFPILTEHGFSPDQIAVMASDPGGEEALDAAVEHLSTLTDMGFSPDQIVPMANRRALEAVIAHFDSLTDMGFSPDQIVPMANRRALEAVIAHFDSLTDMGFSPDQIVIMTNMRTLEGVLEHFDSLTAIGFSPDQIAIMASNSEGMLALEAMVVRQARREADEQG